MNPYAETDGLPIIAENTMSNFPFLFLASSFLIFALSLCAWHQATRISLRQSKTQTRHFRDWLEVTPAASRRPYFYDLSSLAACGAYCIGRSACADIPLSDPRLSRIHAKLSRWNQMLLVCDLGSANGVLVNGQYARCAVLQSGDELQLGDTRLVYRRSFSSSS
jgi:hypothetical protein